MAGVWSRQRHRAEHAAMPSIGERIEVADLPAGTVAWHLDFGGDRHTVVSPLIAPGSVARMARHVQIKHAFTLDDGEWDVLICSVETCADARIWLAVIDPLPVVTEAASTA